jgi:hypothetical protein
MLKCFKSACKQLRTYSTSLPSIYALASGMRQPCGIAVVRISGTKCLKIIEKMTNISTDLEPTKMYYKNIYHPKSNVKIDKALVVWFEGQLHFGFFYCVRFNRFLFSSFHLIKGPKSFTGEDVCEFHCHGGPAVLALLFDALSTFDGIRMAEPGEFSKRFLFYTPFFNTFWYSIRLQLKNQDIKFFPGIPKINQGIQRFRLTQKNVFLLRGILLRDLTRKSNTSVAQLENDESILTKCPIHSVPVSYINSIIQFTSYEIVI